MICGGYYCCNKLEDGEVTDIRITAVVIGDVEDYAEAERTVLAFARTNHPEKDGWLHHECRLATLNDTTVFKDWERRHGKKL